jgi:hypothetical protein
MMWSSIRTRRNMPVSIKMVLHIHLKRKKILKVLVPIQDKGNLYKI